MSPGVLHAGGDGWREKHKAPSSCNRERAVVTLGQQNADLCWNCRKAFWHRGCQIPFRSPPIDLLSSPWCTSPDPSFAGWKEPQAEEGFRCICFQLTYPAAREKNAMLECHSDLLLITALWHLHRETSKRNQRKGPNLQSCKLAEDTGQRNTAIFFLSDFPHLFPVCHSQSSCYPQNCWRFYTDLFRFSSTPSSAGFKAAWSCITMRREQHTKPHSNPQPGHTARSYFYTPAFQYLIPTIPSTQNSVLKSLDR